MTNGKQAGECDGYFDDVAAVFSANQHPIIFLDAAAMRWMGAHVFPRDNVDLLVKDNQIDDILADFLATGLFERVEQNLKFRLHDISVSTIPRVRYIEDHYLLSDSCLSLWPESAYMLPISSTSDELVEVQDVIAMNLHLVEERFDPYAGQEFRYSNTGWRIFLPVHGLTAKFKCPLYIPSLPRFIDALLDQMRCNQREGHAMLSSYNVSNLIRYLLLERPGQLEKLLPMLAERNRADMKILMNRHRRKPVFLPSPHILALEELLRS